MCSWYVYVFVKESVECVKTLMQYLKVAILWWMSETVCAHMLPVKKRPLSRWMWSFSHHCNAVGHVKEMNCSVPAPLRGPPTSQSLATLSQLSIPVRELTLAQVGWMLRPFTGNHYMGSTNQNQPETRRAGLAVWVHLVQRALLCLSYGLLLQTEGSSHAPYSTEWVHVLIHELMQRSSRPSSRCLLTLKRNHRLQ